MNVPAPKRDVFNGLEDSLKIHLDFVSVAISVYKQTSYALDHALVKILELETEIKKLKETPTATTTLPQSDQ